jgi:hypothetical protein
MHEILAAGASIIIRPGGSEGFRFLDCKYLVCIEIHDLRNGLMGDDLDDIFARALEWVKDVQFYHGTQWTEEQIARMSKSAGSA